jgi:tetratricopeptide (TPR) repeat protein
MKLDIKQTLQKATSLHKKGKIEEAEHLYREILEIKPDHSDANHNLGIIENSRNKAEVALSLFKAATEANPNIEQYWISYTNTLIHLKQFEEAEVNYKKAIKFRPNFIIILSNLGSMFKDLSRLDEAEATYKKVIELKTDNAEIYYNLSIVLEALEKLDEAEVSYKKAIKLKPDLVNAHYNLSVILQKVKKLNEAEASYKKTIELKPDHVDALNNLGALLLDLNKLAESKTILKKSILANPNYSKNHYNLAVTLKKLGRIDEAEISCKKSLELKPDYAESHNLLGIIQNELGKFSEAIISYEKALVLKPSFDFASYNLAFMLYSKQEYQKAAKYFALSDYRTSKEFLLKCFLELDEKTKFNRLLDSLIEQGKNNPMIGSIISQAEIKYDVSRLNPFCKKPLEHVFKTNLLKQCDFKNTFVKIANDILCDSKVQKRFQGLLSNGVQTSGNIFTQRGKVTNEIEKIIYSEIETYRGHFKDSTEGFLKNWPKDFYINGWLVSMKSGGSLSPHMHELGWVSGSVYINVPAKSKTDSGNLVVSIGDRENATISEKKMIDVVTGSLCLFPSSLYHYTIPFEAEEERIVLAFDVIPK